MATWQHMLTDRWKIVCETDECMEAQTDTRILSALLCSVPDKVGLIGCLPCEKGVY